MTAMSLPSSVLLTASSTAVDELARLLQILRQNTPILAPSSDDGSVDLEHINEEDAGLPLSPALPASTTLPTADALPSARDETYWLDCTAIIFKVRDFKDSNSFSRLIVKM